MSVTVLLLFLLQVILTIFQGFFNKLYSASYRGPEKAVSPLFSMVYGFICALTALGVSRFSFCPDRTTVLMGCANAVCLSVYNQAFIRASQQGSLALTTMTATFGGILIPLFFSVFAWGESISAVNAAGAALMLLSLVLFNRKTLGGKTETGGSCVLWLSLLFLSNGIYCVLLTSQQIAAHYTLRSEMLIITFGLSGLISAACLFFMKPSASGFRVFRSLPRACILFMILSGLCASGAANLLMVIIRYIPAYIIYPVVNGSFMLFNSLLAAVFLKEKLNALQITALWLAAGSILLLNL